jgi:hypothetical protein
MAIVAPQGRTHLCADALLRAEHAGRGTSYARHDCATGLVHRVRFVKGMEYWESGDDQSQPCSWVIA